MNKTRIAPCIALATVIVFTLAAFSQAQDHSRRISPAFPIGAGEKMLVIAGKNFSDPTNFGTSSVLINDGSGSQVFSYQLVLPVGTTLKRIVADVVDQDSDVLDIINISIFRSPNLAGATAGTITLRTISSIGITSAHATDFSQLVSNPMAHSMLQGWTYWITISLNSDTTSAQRVGEVKVIYQP